MDKPNKKRPRKQHAVMVPTTPQHLIKLPEIVSQFITIKPTLPPTSIIALSTDDQLQQYTAPLPDNTGATPLTSGSFYWKFACELDVKTRKAPAGRAWYIVKEELERYYQLRAPKQQKKGLVASSLLAYPWTTWFAAGNMRKRDLFVPGAPAPLMANDVIIENTRIIIVRLPQKMVSRLYEEAGPTLFFTEAETEEERIAKISSFNYYLHGGPGGPNGPSGPSGGWEEKASGRPPPSYRCHNCGQPGHWKQQCKSGRRMAPKGIPKRFLEQVELTDDAASTYVLEDGTTVRANFPNKGALF